MTISKTTITYTVLHRADEPLPDLHDVLGMVMDGEHLVGDETSRETEEIPDDQVPAEALALGTVPTFFEDDLQ